MKSTYTPVQTDKLAFLFLIFVVALASCGSRSDEDIQKAVNEKLGATSGAMRGNVTATVKNGVVQLSGTCETQNCADSVASVVKEVDGVKSVENKVQQTQAETDFTLRTSVQTIISKYQGVQADVSGGVIVLRGLLSRDQLQPLMNELSALNPKKIDNQLAVQ
jgi:hyperosmotically inducible periplasmic protein